MHGFSLLFVYQGSRYSHSSRVSYLLQCLVVCIMICPGFCRPFLHVPPILLKNVRKYSMCSSNNSECCFVMVRTRTKLQGRSQTFDDARA